MILKYNVENKTLDLKKRDKQTFNSSLEITILQPRLQTIGFFGLYSHSCRWFTKFSSRTTAVQP